MRSSAGVQVSCVQKRRTPPPHLGPLQCWLDSLGPGPRAHPAQQRGKPMVANHYGKASLAGCDRVIRPNKCVHQRKAMPFCVSQKIIVTAYRLCPNPGPQPSSTTPCAQDLVQMWSGSKEGSIFKAHGLLDNSALGSRVITKKTTWFWAALETRYE